MTNYLEIEKERIRYWSRIIALLLTLTSLIASYCQGRNLLGFLSEKEQAAGKGLMILFLLLIGLVSYGVNYYVVSSLFWPGKGEVLPIRALSETKS